MGGEGTSQEELIDRNGFAANVEEERNSRRWNSNHITTDSDFINNSAASSEGPPPAVSPFLSVNFNKTSQDDADYDENEIHK